MRLNSEDLESKAVNKPHITSVCVTSGIIVHIALSFVGIIVLLGRAPQGANGIGNFMIPAAVILIAAAPAPITFILSFAGYMRGENPRLCIILMSIMVIPILIFIKLLV